MEAEEYYNASGVEQREWEYRQSLVRSADDASLGSRSSLSGDNDGGNPNQQSEPEQEPEPTQQLSTSEIVEEYDNNPNFIDEQLLASVSKPELRSPID